MDDRTEIQEFLASRRARITPEQAGLPAYGGNRRVKGLRLLAAWAATGDRRTAPIPREDQLPGA
jgi:hypothetical protein